jgi:hypothetical protein
LKTLSKWPVPPLWKARFRSFTSEFSVSEPPLATEPLDPSGRVVATTDPPFEISIKGAGM